LDVPPSPSCTGSSGIDGRRGDCCECHRARLFPRPIHRVGAPTAEATMRESSSANPDKTPIVTVIHVLDVGGDDRGRVVARLAAALEEVVGSDPSASSSQVQRSGGGARVVHCVQWRSRGALEAILGVAGAKARMAAIQRIAGQEPHLYEWSTFGACGGRAARCRWLRFARRLRGSRRLRFIARLRVTKRLRFDRPSRIMKRFRFTVRSRC
jgi:hypothetical protein